MPSEGERAAGGTGDDLVIIIVNYRTPALVADNLRALAQERARFGGFHVVVVEGGSGDGSAETIAAAIDEIGCGGWVRLLPLEINGGFGYANNQAILTLAAEGRLPAKIMLLNPDAAVLPGALAALCARLDSRPRIAAVGAQLESAHGEPLASAFLYPDIREEFVRAARTGFIQSLFGAAQPPLPAPVAVPVPWATGAAILFRRAALEDVGIFNDRFFLYFEETELCRRLRRAGWDIWIEPAARILHWGGAATNLRDPETGLPLMKRVPAYWLESRRRYFVLAGGRAHALLAGLAWLAGHAFWLTRHRLTLRPPPKQPHLGRDFLRYSLLPRAGDQGPPARIGDPPGAPPAWMARREKRA